MYGLICENVSAYITQKYGEDTWDNIRRLANIDSPTFSVHKERFIKISLTYEQLLSDISLIFPNVTGLP